MEQSYLYVIAACPDGPVKLGISSDPARRLNQLQTGHDQRLVLQHIEPVERAKAPLLERLLHRDIRHLRKRGEWFALPVAHAIQFVQHTIIAYDGVDDLANKVKRRRI